MADRVARAGRVLVRIVVCVAQACSSVLIGGDGRQARPAPYAPPPQDHRP